MRNSTHTLTQDTCTPSDTHIMFTSHLCWSAVRHYMMLGDVDVFFVCTIPFSLLLVALTANQVERKSVFHDANFPHTIYTCPRAQFTGKHKM